MQQISCLIGIGIGNENRGGRRGGSLPDGAYFVLWNAAIKIAGRRRKHAPRRSQEEAEPSFAGASKGDSAPIGTRFSTGKSSVLYLCFRLTPERTGHGTLHMLAGWCGSGLLGVSRTGGFCPDKWMKYGFAQRAKSAWTEKEAKVYQRFRFFDTIRF